MATPDFVPSGTYADVTGVVDATAAGEVAALGVILLAILPNSATGVAGASPDYDQIVPEVEQNLRAEIAALLAAVAAAPTS